MSLNAKQCEQTNINLLQYNLANGGCVCGRHNVNKEFFQIFLIITKYRTKNQSINQIGLFFSG